MGQETNPSSCESTGKARTRLARYNRMISSQAYYTEEGILTCPQSSLSLLLILTRKARPRGARGVPSPLALPSVTLLALRVQRAIPSKDDW